MKIIVEGRVKIIDLVKVINTKIVSDKVLDALNGIATVSIDIGCGLRFDVKRISISILRSIPNKYYDTYTYIPASISDDNGNILCYADSIDYFIEILNAFGRDISPFFDRKYGRIYSGDKAEFESIIVYEAIDEDSKRGIYYLALKALIGDIIYLESVDCHAIAAKTRRILYKCTEEKLVSNNMINIVS